MGGRAQTVAVVGWGRKLLRSMCFFAAMILCGSCFSWFKWNSTPDPFENGE